MILAAHQPNYLPNLGFLYKMFQSEKFVVITNLQFEKTEGWQRRHKIKAWNGDLWLTVPICGSSRQKIKEVKINNISKWRQKHSKTMALVYKDTVHRDILKEFIRVYDYEWERLVDLNFEIIKLLKDILKLPGELILDEDVNGFKYELLINTCKKHGASTYLSGMGGKDYMNDEYIRSMAENNIKCVFIRSDLTGMYPYTSLHYILTKGPQWVRSKIAVYDISVYGEKDKYLSVRTGQEIKYGKK